MKSIKKFFTLITATSIFSFFSAYANPLDNLREYNLENGLKVFLLEDSNDAAVHIEYACKAGFSSQTQNTCGFFKLFSRLIKASTNSIQFSDIQCNSDSTRYFINTTPDQTSVILEKLSQNIFSPIFSDEILNAELTKLKNEVTDNAEDLSTYLNAAIDSRVFSDAPWKNDSGIYPPLFKKTTAKNARTILQDISDYWYTPGNSALFIYGNINSEKLLVTIKETFGRFYSSYKTPVEKPNTPVNNHRKYVFHNPEISQELTQVIIQYTMLTLEEGNLLAAALNNNASGFKNNLLSIQELNIPGAEYIDIASAHKRDSSRLIIQTLLQPPENKTLAIPSVVQAEEFLEEVQASAAAIDNIELIFAKNQLQNSLYSQTSTPADLMNNLSSYWAFKQYLQDYENDSPVFENSPLANSMMNQNHKILQIDLQTLSTKVQSEAPFVFVIINSKDYKANKKAYEQAGYEEINENNSSWYVQSMYEEIRNQFKATDKPIFYSQTKTQDNNYYQKNIELLKRYELDNGINIITKQNSNSNGLSLLLSIKGGKINSADDNGFEEIMINLLAGIIEKEIYKKQYEGIITGYPQVSVQTDISTSSILIEFDKEDDIAVCQAISTAVIYGEIAPAAADKAVSSKQYRKRLENGSAVNQLYSAAINAIDSKSDYSKIFESEKDVLSNTNYASILAAYPALLDASRYTAILTGNFDDNTVELLKHSLSFFYNSNQILNTPVTVKEVPKSKNIKVKVRHTFLTDIPAEKAGPQPAVLIPTTEFLDPVIYITKSPVAGTKDAALFNAVLNFLGQKLQDNINKSPKFNNSNVLIQLPKSNLDFGTVIIQNVAHTKEADSIYNNTIQSIIDDLEGYSSNEKTIQEIKNLWILQQMTDSMTNSGTARLLQKGLEMLPEQIFPELYLEEYNYIQSADITDYINIMQWFPKKANLRVYSTDGKL